jgi:transcriptional regulator with XRE-family HTH domain
MKDKKNFEISLRIMDWVSLEMRKRALYHHQLTKILKFQGGNVMELNYKLMGERIKTIRKERGLSQQQLAELVNISEPYISYVETGKKRIGLTTLVDISHALNVTVDQILVGIFPVPENKTAMVEILSDCSEYEKRVIIEAGRAIKRTMREIS